MGLNLRVSPLGEQGVPTGGTTCPHWGDEVSLLGERKHVFHGFPWNPMEWGSYRSRPDGLRDAAHGRGQGTGSGWPAENGQ